VDEGRQQRRKLANRIRVKLIGEIANATDTTLSASKK
jgi:hypothetical protein